MSNPQVPGNSWYPARATALAAPTARGRVVSRTISIVAMLALLAVDLAKLAPAQDGRNHGIGLSITCDSPKCAGEWLDCSVDIYYCDECQDAILIHEAYAVVDPEGHATRVPATGNLWITGAWGNTTISTNADDWPMPFTPFLIGFPGDTYGGLPGSLDAPGWVRIALLPDDPNVSYQIQETDPDPLRTFVWMIWEDMCNHYNHDPCPDCPAGALLPGATASDTIVSQNPNCDVSNDGPACEGDDVQLFANAGGGTPPYTYTWAGPSGFMSTEADPIVSPAVPGEYCLTVTDDDGCDTECCTTVVLEPCGGNEGCTPGYWKQEHHFDNWTAPYTPETLFSDVFEDAFPGMTLLDVLWQGGGGLNALGRHTVAALLNAASPSVHYELPLSDVIEMFNDVFPGTKQDYNALKDLFEEYNQAGCPLGEGQDEFCFGDLDGDRDVDSDDLKCLLSNYGMTGASYQDGDIYPPTSGDGTVNIQDLAGMLGIYGTTCPQ